MWPATWNLDVIATRAALPRMLEHGGAIVNTGSVDA